MSRVPPPESGRSALPALLLGATLLVSFGCGGGEKAEPPAEEAAPVEEAPATKEPEPPRPAPSRVTPPPTGTLEISGTPGATVALDGRSVGTTPGRWEDLDAGEYAVRVEKEGFHPFEVSISIPGGRTRSLSADLTEILGSIVVESDVPGAMVFLDRAFKGNTPITITDLRPGEYNLTVSAEGHEVERRRVQVARAPVAVGVDFGDIARQLDTSVPVIHKHRFGSCEGALAASPEGFEYRTDHKDAFRLPFEQVERFELDYLQNNLRIKVRGGRTYNFESPSEDLEALFVFHRDVSAFREEP